MGKSGNPAKRAQQETALRAIENDDAEPFDADSLEDFDAFWREQSEQGNRRNLTTTIMGEQVTLPPAVPILFDLESKRLAKSKSLSDMKRLVSILFGEGAMERWARKGMDADQFAVLIAWAPLRIAGQEVTLRQVADQLDALEGRAGEA
jgi:hypothetical protein